MGGSAAAPSPYQQVTTTEEMPKWKKELLGFTPNASEYSPFKALSRQAGTQAKIIEGMTTRPSWSSMYEAFGVQPGTDLTPYIQAMRTGTQGPMAPIPASPAAGTIPEFTAPAENAPKKKAAQGGLMSLRGYAAGDKVKPLTTAQQQRVLNISKAIKNGTVTQAQIDTLNRIESSTGLNVSPYSDTGTGTPKNPKIANAATTAATAYQNQQKTNADANAPSAITTAQAMNVVTPFYNPVGAENDPYGGVTNPIYKEALDQLRGVSKAPEQFGQATGIMQGAADRLMGMSNYTPQQIQAQQIEAANIARGDIRDVSAQQAEVERMQGGPNVQGIQAQANQMAAPERVAGQSYDAAQIAPTRRERAATTTAPKTWTDPGVSQQYMNPYAQAVINQNVQESNRNFQKNLSALRGQAAKSKAYGGSRQGLEEAEALRNQGYLLADIQDKGLSQAYQQGMGQFQAEQGLGSQVGMSNTAQINQLKQQYMQMGLSEAQANQAAQNQASQFGAQSAQQAALANQQAGLTTGQANLSAAQQTELANQQAGMTAQQLNQLYGQGGFQTQAANQAAQNQAYNNYMQQQLQAQLQNQGMDYNTAQQNAAMLMQSRTANQQAALQAATQNQQAGLTAQGMNLQALNQAGQMGQGIGALGSSMWNLQQNIPQMWGAAGQTTQNIAQQAATGAQQTAQNWLGGMNAAYAPVTNLLGNAPGGTSTRDISQAPR